jgi:hypothetical protein
MWPASIHLKSSTVRPTSCGSWEAGGVRIASGKGGSFPSPKNCRLSDAPTTGSDAKISGNRAIFDRISKNNAAENVSNVGQSNRDDSRHGRPRPLSEREKEHCQIARSFEGRPFSRSEYVQRYAHTCHRIIVYHRAHRPHVSPKFLRRIKRDQCVAIDPPCWL